jgi:AraC-like DNA-binding protein
VLKDGSEGDTDLLDAGLSPSMKDAVTSLVRELQLACGRLVEGGDLEHVKRLLEELPVPTSRLEDMVIRGIIYDWTARAGIHLVIDCCAGSPPRYTLHSSGELATERVPGIVARARVLLNECLESINTSTDLARMVGCSATHLSRLFKRSYGVPLGAYMHSARTVRGLFLLTNTELKVDAIAHMVGFRGKSNFYRAVRDHTGMTPAQYRRRRAA